MKSGRAVAIQALAGFVGLAGLAGCSNPSAYSAHNLVLIAVDPLATAQLGCGGDPQARTPGWDRLARQGAQFCTAIASSPLAWTGTATLLGGHHPFRHGLRGGGDDVLVTPSPVLAQAVRTAGFATGAFGMLAPRDAARGLDRGFDAFEEAVAGDPDAAVQAGLEWLDGVAPDRPFLLHVRLGEPDSPPPPWSSVAYPDRSPTGGTAAVDRALTRLLRGIDWRGRARRTLVLATAAYAGAGVPALDELSIHVPLVAWGPFPWRGGSLRSGLARAIDIYPTLLGAVRVGPDWQLPGRDLAPRLKPHREAKLFAYAETGSPARPGSVRAWRTIGWKYVEADHAALYDLAADPGERENLADREPARATDFAAKLRELVEAPPPRRIGG